MDEFVFLYLVTVHPDCVYTFKELTGVENHEVLKPLSLVMKKLFEEKVSEYLRSYQLLQVLYEPAWNLFLPRRYGH